MRFNWKIVGPVTALGVVFIVTALWLSGDKSGWASVLVNLGTTLVLVGILAFLEPRLLRRVSKAAGDAATAATEQVTRDIAQRLTRLEDLDSAADETQRRQRRAADEAVADVETGNATASSIGQLVVDGQHERLFDERFRVRTGPDLTCSELYFLPLVDGTPKVVMLFMDFEPIFADTTRARSPADLMQAIRKTDSTVVWADQGAHDVGAELIAALHRLNMSSDGFRFGHALKRLTASLQLMREARDAPTGSPKRLKGRLRLMINDDWVLTDEGLEATNRDVVFRSVAYRLVGMGVSIFSMPTYIEATAAAEDETSYAEALQWVRDRLGWEVREPGEPAPRDKVAEIRATADEITRLTGGS